MITLDKSLDKMRVLKKISEALATNEAKKDRLKNFILLLMLEWEDFESHLDLTGLLFRECLAELQSRETHLSSVQESVSESSKEMDMTRKSLEQKFDELVEKEKEFCLFQEKRSNELKLQEETLGMIREEIEVRELKLNEQEKLIQGLFDKIELEQKEFESIKSSVGDRFNEIGLKEYHIEQRANELDLKEQKLMQREKEIESREKILYLKMKEIELKGKQFDSAKISNKHLQYSGSEAKHGLHLNEEESLACTERGKQLTDAAGHIASHNMQNVTDHKSKKLLDSSVDSTTIWESCCFFCDVRKVLFKRGLKKDFFCQNCSKYYVAFSSAMGYEENGNIKMLKSCTATERNGDVLGDARFDDKDGSVNLLHLGKGDYDVLRIDHSWHRESSESINQSRKRGSSETGNEVIAAEEVLADIDHHFHCTPFAQLLPISEQGRESGADDIPSSSKRLRVSNNHDEQSEATLLQCSACGNSTGFSAGVDNGKLRIGEGNSPIEQSLQDCDINDIPEFKGNAPTEESLQNCDVIDVSGSGSAGHSVIGIMYPPGEFNDFDKYREENCFSPGQIWACYDDTHDPMPRFYAQIMKVHVRPFKLCINWLYPHPGYQGGIDWVNRDLPVACGKFARDNSEHITTFRIFSHQVNYDKNMDRLTYTIYPRNGEIWALFKDWDIRWRSNLENHPRMRYEYQFVEVVKEYVESTAVEVAFLDKVGGFLSLYQRKIQGKPVLIPPNQLLRFSHRVPSYTMHGTEGEGVPEGSFELDPAAIPLAPQ